MSTICKNCYQFHNLHTELQITLTILNYSRLGWQRGNDIFICWYTVHDCFRLPPHNFHYCSYVGYHTMHAILRFMSSGNYAVPALLAKLELWNCLTYILVWIWLTFWDYFCLKDQHHIHCTDSLRCSWRCCDNPDVASLSALDTLSLRYFGLCGDHSVVMA